MLFTGPELTYVLRRSDNEIAAAADCFPEIKLCPLIPTYSLASVISGEFGSCGRE
jgi:hypothetical protein